MSKMIAAFDFDNTVINCNSDTYIDRLVKKKNGERFSYPSTIKEAYEQHGWTRRMQAVFDYMHSEFGITESEFVSCLKEIKIDECMKRLFSLLKENNYNIVIISDANSIFIETILKENGLDMCLNIKEDIYTNTSHFNEVGQLNVVPFNQTYNKGGEPFNCDTKMCTSNICKGSVLKDILKAEKFPFVESSKFHIFVGDGYNDYCAGLALKSTDKFFVRKDFALYKRLQTSNLLTGLVCDIVYWKDANDIINHITF